MDSKKKWIVSCRIPHIHSDKLLKILRHRLLPNLPKSTKTLLYTTSAEYEIEERYGKNKRKKWKIQTIL